MRKFIFNGMNIGYTAPERAQDVSYDNTSGRLSGTNVQSAIDELSTTTYKWSGTQAQYDALQEIDPDVSYYILPDNTNNT